uniref:Isopentenyl phosphate kinase n=1 Tax=Chenopodium quinoa TaxID=63459 RepID=A0A803MNK0_CHEQI
MEKGTATPLTKPLRCIVKLGGAAITCKNELEKINEENLRAVSIHLREAMMSGEIVDMDWSKRPEKADVSVDVDGISDQITLESSNFVVVHGAGSFGHFQASKSGAHKGGLDQSLVKAGFVATRISVTSLNLEIVRALAREGIPSVGISPFSGGWTTFQRNVASADVTTVAKTIDSGFIPVLHGDAVLDHSQGCTILSGDVIIRHIAEILKPKYVVFLLLTAVDEEGSWRVVNPAPKSMNEQVEITVAAHDTTGGMVTKISEAAAIAKLGIDVYIVKAATDHSLKALKGEVKGKIPDDWMGTAIRFMRK